MQTPSGRRIFSIGEAVYVWEDVVLAAILWGDRAVLEREGRDGLACLHRLEDVEDEDEAYPEQEAGAVAARFRRCRGDGKRGGPAMLLGSPRGRARFLAGRRSGGHWRRNWR